MRPTVPRPRCARGPGGIVLSALLLLALVPSGCDAPVRATAAPEPSVSDSAGVRIFHFPETALGVRSPRQPAAEPSVRIGVVEGPDEYQWTRPTAAVRLSGGGFAVAEGTPAEIRVFDSRGSFVRRIGRPGEGPGEFRSPQALAALPDGGIVVWDVRTRRRSHFDAAGALRSEATLRDLTPLRSLNRVALLPDGRLVVVGRGDGPDVVSNRGQAREPLEVRATGTGIDSPVDLLRLGPLVGITLGDEQEVITESSGGGDFMSISVASQWYWGRLYTWASPDGLWVAERLGMEAKHYGAGGGLDRVIRVDGAGPRVTRALVDSVEAVEVDQWARQMGDELTDEIRALIRDDMAGRDYPETFPAMDALFADVHGNPWIGLPNPPSASPMASVFPEVPRWLVFGRAPGADGAAGIAGAEPSGTAGEFRLLGVVNLPRGSHPVWADDEGVLLVRIDPDLGIAYVEWYDWVDG